MVLAGSCVVYCALGTFGLCYFFVCTFLCNYLLLLLADINTSTFHFAANYLSILFVFLFYMSSFVK